MLGKLLKYELKSTSRFMLFLYAAVLAVGTALGLVIRLAVALGNMEVRESSLIRTASGISPIVIILIIFAAVYVMLLLVMQVMTVIMIILRFNNNLLMGEGYLMHMLPVSATEHVLSKGIIAILWEVIAAAVATVSALLLMLGSGLLAEAIRQGILSEIFENLFDLVQTGTLVLAVINGIITVISMILHFYFCMAVGNLANKNKMLWAVIAFVGTNIVTSILTVVINSSLLRSLDNVVNGFMGRTAAVNAVLAAAYFIGTTWILKRRLNLA